MMTDDEDTRITIRIPTEAMNQLEEELNCFNTKSGIFQHLAQSYLDNQLIPRHEMRQKTVCEEKGEE